MQMEMKSFVFFCKGVIPVAVRCRRNITMADIAVIPVIGATRQCKFSASLSVLFHLMH